MDTNRMFFDGGLNETRIAWMIIFIILILVMFHNYSKR